MTEGTIWSFQLDDKSDKAFKKLHDNFDKLENSVDHLEGNTAKNFGKMEKSTNKMGGSLAQLGNEVPMVGRSMALLANPITMVVGAVIAVGLAVNKAKNAAMEFNHEFLELKNLNLSKSTEEVEALRDSVLSISFEKGLDPEKTSKAFFDVQSATGKYGKEVEDIVGKVGVFARTMKADYNTSIDGASKAMGIFGFGANQLDEYLASNYKTVQVGITTFDQLAKVQTEYGGAAAAAGQDFNEANKVFALFSKTAKSVDIAATLTKTAFQDLAKKSTITGLDKIGVSVFDATGNMRKMEDIVKDLVPKLSKMNDSDFSNLKEDIGGSEGLRSLLDQMKNSGEDVLTTFQSFNDVDFDFDKALENANGDLQVMSDIVDNKLSVAWIKFGDAVLPIFIKIKSIMADIIDGAAKVFSLASDGYTMFSKGDEKFRTDLKEQSSEKEKAANKSDVEQLIKDVLSTTNKDDALSKLQGLAKSTSESYEGVRAKGFDTPRKIWEATGIKEEEDKLHSLLKDAYGKMKSGQKGSFEEMAKYYGIDMNAAKSNYQNSLLIPSEDEGSTSGSSKSNRSGLSGITGATDKVRNVTVNIQNLVNDFVVNAATGHGLSENDILSKIEETLVRAVRDAELTLSRLMPLHHSSDIIGKMAKLSKFMDRDVPRIVGTEATKFFKDRFIKQGWEDGSFEPWKPRKVKDRQAGKRKVLVKSGALMNSINYEIRGNKVVVSSRDIPYAQIHNEGGTISSNANVRKHTRTTRSGRSTSVRSHSRQMNITIPQRQFIGSSKALDRKIEAFIIKRIEKILNS